MRKLFLFAIFSLATSCTQGLFGNVCTTAPAHVQEAAQSYYDSFGTTISSMSYQEAKKTFGCYYRNGDKVYSYKTFWGEKLILTRFGEVITYAERKKEKPARHVYPTYQGY